ncbi:MAG TPA: transketolase [Pirellulales bacterium]|nr:transketolase [Pirellulales bacterium]
MKDVLQAWKELAAQLRVDSIRCSTAAGSGHPTSSLSAADLMAVLVSKYLKYDWNAPENPNNDRLIFSKGHASPLLYSIYKAVGAIDDDELMTYRRFGSRLQGHPNPRVLPWVEAATGSLGQGIGIGVGMAINGKYLDELPYRTWVLLGDSEMAEGSVWEAFDKASYYQLNHLIAIIDMNRLGQRGETELGWDAAGYANRCRAFGWNAIELNGHDLPAIDLAFAEALAQQNAPSCLIAKTIKGRGVEPIENADGWHGKALPPDMAEKAIAALGGERRITVSVSPPENQQPARTRAEQPLKLPVYKVGEQHATRKAYGDALAALGASRGELVVLDGEVSNSTHSDEFQKAFPDRFFEMFIAEQQMLAAGVGLARTGKMVFTSTFAAFWTRAFDQIRMAAISNVDLKLCGSHAGVSIGEDGPSQMGLEDLAMMRTVFGSTVLYPCDANQTARLVERMAETSGICYLRTTRGKTDVIYDEREAFEVGGSKTLRQSDDDRVAIVAAGITLHEAQKACDSLEAEGIRARLIDAYSVKPIDRDALFKADRDTGGRLVVVEDHWAEGGLGAAVTEAFALGTFGAGPAAQPTIVQLAVQEMPGSGAPAELLSAAGIDAEHIAQAVRELAAGKLKTAPASHGIRLDQTSGSPK